MVCFFLERLGGFSTDGREYAITIEAGRSASPALPPAPWSNVIADESFGCLTTEAGLGYSWSGNSQMNRLTPWSNDPGFRCARRSNLLPRRRNGRDLEAVPLVEKAIVNSGVILLKYWLEVSPEEQTRRLEERINDGRKIWKLSPMDLKSYSRWHDYSKARDDMFLATDNAWAPWFVARSDNKKRARLNIITHMLSKIPYEEVHRPKVELPKRQKREGYKELEYSNKMVPETF